MSLPKSIICYCNEDISKIENYYEALNSDEVYDVHHRLELDTGKYISAEELISSGLYYNRPANELILLSHSAHATLHNNFGYPEKGIKISRSRKGHPVSKETREKIRNSRLLHNSLLTEEEWKKEYACSEETKQKISVANKGRKLKPISEETRAKLSTSLIKRWENPEYKKRLSERISEGVKKTYTDEHKQKISIANRGRKRSQEFKENCRQRNLGKKVSEETRAKMRASSKHLKTALGKHWYTNGTKNIQAFECPEGYKLGITVIRSASEETRAKMREAHSGEKNHFYGKHHSNESKAKISATSKGRHKYNNGIIEVSRYECPEGFVPGRLKRKELKNGN